MPTVIQTLPGPGREGTHSETTVVDLARTLRAQLVETAEQLWLLPDLLQPLSTTIRRQEVIKTLYTIESEAEDDALGADVGRSGWRSGSPCSTQMRSPSTPTA